MTVPASIDLDTNKALDWLSKGAQPTDTARSILRFKGVMYLKHLQRGVSKGAFDQEEADRLYREWMDSKDEQIEARRAKEKKKREDYLRRLSGKPGDSKVVDHSAATEELEEFREAAGEAEPAVEEAKDESGSVAEEKPAAATEEVVAAAQEEE
jgi:small subunit ribosomal protein S16